MRAQESELIKDSRVFDGKNLRPFLRPNFRRVDERNDLDKVWGEITLSMPSMMDSSCYAFVNEPIVRQIQDYIRGIAASKILDILGGGHSFVPSDVIDVSRRAMDLNPHALRKYKHNVNGDTEIHKIVGENRYDLMTIINGMGYIREPEKLFTSARKGLQDSGRIVVGFDTRYEEAPATYLWHMISEIMRDEFGLAGPPKGQFDFQLDMRWRRALVAHWLRSAGFKNIHADLLPIPWMGRYCGSGAEQTEFAMVTGEKT